MVCDIRNIPTRRNNQPTRQHVESPKKRPVQLGEPLHELITMIARDDNLSLEQIISSAVITKARLRLDTPDREKQTRYFLAIKKAENEIKQRYHGEKARRSIQMRRINDARRKRAATPNLPQAASAPYDLPVSPSSSNSIYAYGYPIEYRYGIPVPVPPRPF